MAAAIRQVRLHLEQRDGLLRKAAKLIFGSDGSLYLVPYANRGEFYYGGRTFAAGQTDDPFNFREQIQADSQPKLSIHATGDVHIYANDQPKAGPVQIPPLADLLGEHVATVQFDSVSSVPEFQGKPRIEGDEVDLAFGVPPDVVSGALLVFANGVENSFRTERLQIAFQAEGPERAPIFFGVAAVEKDPLGDDGTPKGVNVIAGFDPLAGRDDPVEYLYLRGL